MDKKIRADKSQLIAAIQDLLQHAAIETQEELCFLLEKQGFNVNQVMISRLLHKLGALKINEDGKIIYRLPTEIITVTPKNSLAQLILNIDCNENLIVILTAPGSAQLVARLLDQLKEKEILGTVAGDDTLFIAPVSVTKIKPLMERIRMNLLG